VKRRATIFCILLVVVSSIGADNAPPRSVALPESEIQDVFFSYIVGVLIEDSPLDVTGETLLSMFPEFSDGSGKVPFHQIRRVLREPHAGNGPSIITLSFDRRIEYPVPVDILGYHPGTVFFSESVGFAESPLAVPDPEFSAVFEVRVRSGELGIDFDQWLDTLLGGWVDDVSARVLSVVRYQDHWYGLLGGETPRGGWITGVYDLRESRIVVRPPQSLRELGRQLGEAEREEEET
jgi:hypothetical protein